MAEFPSEPIAPSEYLEKWLPQAWVEADLPPASREVDVKLGVRLDGEGGGEWLLEVSGGRLAVQPASRSEAAFTVVQSVEDWRGGLWEGRGGAIGKGTAAFFRPGESPPGATPGQMGGAPSAQALKQMQQLSGVIRMVVAGGDEGDYRVDFKLGPGEIPAEPTTTVTVQAADAAAMERGELDPMTAFMSGRLLVTGDMTLMMQMQAIQMQAAAQG